MTIPTGLVFLVLVAPVVIVWVMLGRWLIQVGGRCVDRWLQRRFGLTDAEVTSMGDQR